MHVLFLTPAYPPFPGGGERYVRSLALNLSEHGSQVTVVTSTAQTMADWGQRPSHLPNPIQETDQTVQVIRCPVYGWPGGLRLLMGWRKLMVAISALPGDQTAVLRKMARHFPPIYHFDTILSQLPNTIDLIHGFNISWEYPLLSGWQMARQRGLPFIVTPFIHLGNQKDRRSRLYTMDHQKRLLRSADRVLALTHVGRSSLIQQGIPPVQIEVIGGGLDPLPNAFDSSQALRQHKLNPLFALFIGRTSHDKGAIHAAQAVNQLRRQGLPVTLALIGTTSPEFKRFHKQLSPAEKEWIRPLGILNEAEKHALLAASQLLLLPSRMDSFGIVLLEAWAHGKPVIGARSGGIPDVIDAEQNGLLVPFGDVNDLASAIKRLWQDEALRSKMGERGRQKVAAQYTWDQVGERVRHSYQQLLTNGRKHGQVAP